MLELTGWTGFMQTEESVMRKDIPWCVAWKECMTEQGVKRVGCQRKEEVEVRPANRCSRAMVWWRRTA